MAPLFSARGAMTRWVLLIAAAILGLGLAITIIFDRRIVDLTRGTAPNAVVQQSERRAVAIEPTLYCDFYNFMHNATVVSFYFAVDLAGHASPNVSELFVVEPDGTRTQFDDEGTSTSPQWTYKVVDGTPTIVSPDSETTILLYGLKPTSGGVFWIEAGLRSNDYRNLDGKCRQANFRTAARAGQP